MRGVITAIYPEGVSSVYNYVCQGEDKVFSFPVEWRYHLAILENEGDPTGREVEYVSEIDPPTLMFLD
jgi:hypothetical protein